MSRASRSRTPGRSTLTATWRPSGVTARWTCATEAEPIGSGSTEANRLSSGRPKLASISRRIAAKGTGGTLSCKVIRLRAASSPTMSGRVASAWPSLIAAGPISWKAPA